MIATKDQLENQMVVIFITVFEPPLLRVLAVPKQEYKNFDGALTRSFSGTVKIFRIWQYLGEIVAKFAKSPIFLTFSKNFFKNETKVTFIRLRYLSSTAFMER